MKFFERDKAIKAKASTIYELVGIVYDDPKCTKAKLQALGTSEIVTKPICEIYEDKKLLEKLPTMQGVFTGILCHAERNGDVTHFQNISQNHLYYFKILPFLSMSFIVLMMLSIQVVAKLVTICGLDFYASIFCYPLVYVIIAIVAEVYGYKYTRRLIWYGLFLNLLFMFVLMFSIYLPASPHWHFQKVYTALYHRIPRKVLGTVISTTVGAFLQTYILLKWKLKTHSEYLILRIFVSMFVGMVINSILFSVIAYSFVVPFHELLELTGTDQLTAMFFLLVGSFFAYVAVEKIKNIDKMDYYDYRTNFNPFSISLED